MAGDNLVVVDTASAMGGLVIVSRVCVLAYFFQKSHVCILLNDESGYQVMGGPFTYRLLTLRVITTLLRITLWRASTIAKDQTISAKSSRGTAD